MFAVLMLFNIAVLEIKRTIRKNLKANTRSAYRTVMASNQHHLLGTNRVDNLLTKYLKIEILKCLPRF